MKNNSFLYRSLVANTDCNMLSCCLIVSRSPCGSLLTHSCAKWIIADRVIQCPFKLYWILLKMFTYLEDTYLNICNISVQYILTAICCLLSLELAWPWKLIEIGKTKHFWKVWALQSLAVCGRIFIIESFRACATNIWMNQLHTDRRAT